MIQQCTNCGKDVNVPPSKAARGHRAYCSTACRKATQTYEMTCEYCGKHFRAYRSTEGRKRFCSKQCRNKGAVPLKEYRNVCTVCGVSFTITGNWQRKNTTCSRECANKARRIASASHDNRVDRVCAVCNKTFRVFPSRTTRYCSRVCAGKGNAKERTGQRRTSIEVQCAYCGKRTFKYASRIREEVNSFCGNECYHKWDSWYKSQPAQREKLIARALTVLAKTTSKTEDRVASWLNEHNLTYERQVTLNHYSMDFKVNGVYIEVQGCYWHGCPTCFVLQTPMQRQRISRDKGKATYCRKRNIPLLTIWEHDIKHNDFSVLTPLLRC